LTKANSFKKLTILLAPVVGIHVRLTDKKQEAKLQKLQHYMVGSRILEGLNPLIPPLKIFFETKLSFMSLSLLLL